MSLIPLLSLPVKGQVLPDEESDHPTQVQLQNLKRPVRDIEIKNKSPVSCESGVTPDLVSRQAPDSLPLVSSPTQKEGTVQDGLLCNATKVD